MAGHDRFSPAVAVGSLRGCRSAAKMARLARLRAMAGRIHRESGKPDRQQRHPGVAPDIGVFDKRGERVAVEDVRPDRIMSSGRLGDDYCDTPYQSA
jgi:hypothetical protein